MATAAGAFIDGLIELEAIVTNPGRGRSNEASLAAARRVLVGLQASGEARDADVRSALDLIAVRLPVLYSERRHQGHEGGAGGVRQRTLADCRRLRSHLSRSGRQPSGRRPRPRPVGPSSSSSSASPPACGPLVPP